MAISDLFKRTQQALSNNPSAAEIRKLVDDAQARLEAVDRELEDKSPEGREYNRVLNEGTPDELVKLKATAEMLDAEAKQLRSRIKELRANLKKTQAREAVASHKERKRAINKACDEAAKAYAAYQEAQKQLEKEVGALRTGITNCKNEAIDYSPLLLDAATVERVGENMQLPGRMNRHEFVSKLGFEIGKRPEQAQRPMADDDSRGALVGDASVNPN